MSKYDQLAFASLPSFYLGAPVTTDQAGSANFTISSNTLAATGQPIIKGHSNSFDMNDTAYAVIAGNPIFRSGVTTEFILVAGLPEEETGIIVADNGSGVFITPDSVVLRLTYNTNESIQSLAAEIPWVNWHKKMHVIVTIGENQATITVNNVSKIISLNGFLDATITETQLGTVGAGYNFLFDGFGVYNRKLSDKSNALDDDSRGHNIYAAAIYGGVSTSFDTYQSGGVTEVRSTDLQYISDIMQAAFFYTFRVPTSDYSNTYVAVETNDDSLSIDWDLNASTVGTFTTKLVVPIIIPGSSLNFRLPRAPQADFVMRIEIVRTGDILSNTPAFLTATGQPIFPASIDDSIVNCPKGVDMQFSSWHGVWLTSDRADLQVPPQSIELIFKPGENGIIFSSADGEVSTTAQTGYVMYLNGQTVTDLDDVLMNQWNHLVLTATGAAATEFDLNDPNGPTSMNYLLLTAYPQVLTAGEAADMYKIAIGADDITVNEIAVGVTEGEFDNGQAFQLFGNNWAIVGSGGN